MIVKQRPKFLSSIPYAIGAVAPGTNTASLFLPCSLMQGVLTQQYSSCNLRQFCRITVATV